MEAVSKIMFYVLIWVATAYVVSRGFFIVFNKDVNILDAAVVVAALRLSFVLITGKF